MERSRSFSISEKSSNKDHGSSSTKTDLRCYSASYVTAKKAPAGTTWPPSATSSSTTTTSAAAGSKAKKWSSGFVAPSELRRKRRVAGYRVYGVEGKVKVSLKSGVRWLKGKCTQVVDGLW
ncbi:uncharacterized protein LOC104581537 [Brachypodium distachyon]|uniref:Uncharacterized protein n=1 Tax=Brachypodium distachyon TaxID=15368 RepID=A0A0Q3NKM9_BRADI|nr:uncharacterized protein LOC104581537 [Brachypodium distachyon]KQK17950.1 hypothetical protein BRADI_1g37742v3 [Brachypodium distachyon]|eukprot:XP_014753142.1 uncharacterized protein LOC104581537 [Brachypodium distachyon]